MLVVLAVYLATLAPDLTFAHFGADGGDLIAAAETVGVPHPPGYPTYTLLARLFTHIPFGSLAYKVNLLSTVCAALSIGFYFQTMRLILPGIWHSLVAITVVLLLAFSRLLWSQAVITEVYALHMLFASLLFWLIARWRTGSSDRMLMIAALLFGFGMGNHLTLVFFLPAAAVLLWPDRSRWMRAGLLLAMVVLLFCGISVYAYLPLAAGHNPPINWGNPQTLDGFIWTVTAAQYRGFVFGLDSENYLQRLSEWLVALVLPLGWLKGLLILWGFRIKWRSDRRLAYFFLAWGVPLSLYAFFYHPADSIVYLLPLLLPAYLFLAQGLESIRCRFEQLAIASGSRLARGYPAVLISLVLLFFLSNWGQVNLHEDFSGREYYSGLLQTIEQDGLVIVRRDKPTFSLWYALYALKERPDVHVVNSNLLAFVWYRQHLRRLYPDLILPRAVDRDVTTSDLVERLVAYNQHRLPVYATDPDEAWYLELEIIQVSDAPLYRVHGK